MPRRSDLNEQLHALLRQLQNEAANLDAKVRAENLARINRVHNAGLRGTA